MTQKDFKQYMPLLTSTNVAPHTLIFIKADQQTHRDSSFIISHVIQYTTWPSYLYKCRVLLQHFVGLTRQPRFSEYLQIHTTKLDLQSLNFKLMT